jgi:hypothetical protein
MIKQARANPFIRALGIIIATAVMMPGLAQAQSHCSGAVRSINPGAPASITFNYANANASEEDSFKVYYADSNGGLVEMFTLFPGQSQTLSTNVFVNTAWVMTSPILGGGESCVGSYITERGPNLVSLGD